MPSQESVAQRSSLEQETQHGDDLARLEATPLFDTQTYTRHYERALQCMWDVRSAGIATGSGDEWSRLHVVVGPARKK